MARACPKCGRDFTVARALVGLMILVALVCFFGGGFMLWQSYYLPAPLSLDPSHGWTLIALGVVAAAVTPLAARRR